MESWFYSDWFYYFILRCCSFADSHSMPSRGSGEGNCIPVKVIAYPKHIMNMHWACATLDPFIPAPTYKVTTLRRRHPLGHCEFVVTENGKCNGKYHRHRRQVGQLAKRKRMGNLNDKANRKRTRRDKVRWEKVEGNWKCSSNDATQFSSQFSRHQIKS